jgi:hypothetical protein
MASDSAFIMVAFYSPPHTDPWLNRLVAHVDGPVCHVELAFPGSNQRSTGTDLETATMNAVCVYFGGRVELTQKQFTRCNYSFQYIPVSQTQRTRVLTLAKQMQTEGVKFSQYSMLATFLRALPLWYNKSASHATCCSILTTQLLQEAGVVDKTVNARRVTPSGLQTLLQANTRSQSFCFGTTPLRLQQMRVTI